MLYSVCLILIFKTDRMEFKTIKVKKGPNVNQLFDACKNISKVQTEVFTIDIEGEDRLLPCYISGITSIEGETEKWALLIIVKSLSLVRHKLDTRASRNSLEVNVEAVYSTKTMTGEINFPVD